MSAGSSPPHARWRRLPGEPGSARQARRFVAEALAGAEGEVLETAQLLTSELVTNAVLHAGTAFEVGVWGASGRVHVSVFDEDRDSVVVRRPDDPDALTGRGLQMVEVLASAYGTEVSAEGKTVWFELWPGWEPGGQSGWAGAGAPAAPTTTVVLRQVPVGLYRAASRHRRALLREGRLACIRDDGPPVDAEELRAATHLSDLIDSQAQRYMAALEPAQYTFDCPLAVPTGSGSAAATMSSVLDSLDRAAAAGLLLTRPALPEIRRFRQWMISQMVSQMEQQRTAEAWQPVSEAADGPWTGVEDHGWDAGSDPAQPPTVAADEDNRIIAVNQAAADLLGYQPDELRAQRLTTLIPEPWRERHVAGFTEFLLTGRSRIIGTPVRLPARHRDGTVIEAMVTITVEQSPRGVTVFVARITPV